MKYSTVLTIVAASVTAQQLIEENTECAEKYAFCEDGSDCCPFGVPGMTSVYCNAGHWCDETYVGPYSKEAPKLIESEEETEQDNSGCHWWGFECSSSKDCCQDDSSSMVSYCDDGFCQAHRMSNEAEQNSDCHWFGFACSSDNDCCQDDSSSMVSFCDDGYC